MNKKTTKETKANNEPTEMEKQIISELLKILGL